MKQPETHTDASATNSSFLGFIESGRKTLLFYSYWLTLILTILLPFLALFNSATKNVDMQGIVLVFAGFFAWLNVGLRLEDHKNWFQQSRTALFALIILLLVGLLSTIVNPHLGYDLWGAHYIGFGYISLLAIIGCGLFYLQIKNQLLIIWLYAICVLLGLTAIPYNLIRLHELIRIGGVFAQADILSIFLGVGLLIGWQLLARYRTYRIWLYITQLILATILILTQTRVVIGLVIVLSLIWLILRSNFLKQHRTKTIVIICSAILLFAIGLFLVPARVTSPSYAEFSVKYRLELQDAALKASFSRPFLGYGIGNLADSLKCQSLQAAPLQQTCLEGYFFNSSHDIYLDRVLAFGWIGGLAYLLFVISSLAKGLAKRGELNTILSLKRSSNCFILPNKHYRH